MLVRTLAQITKALGIIIPDGQQWKGWPETTSKVAKECLSRCSLRNDNSDNLIWSKESHWKHLSIHVGRQSILHTSHQWILPRKHYVLRVLYNTGAWRIVREEKPNTQTLLASEFLQANSFQTKTNMHGTYCREKKKKGHHVVDIKFSIPHIPVILMWPSSSRRML